MMTKLTICVKSAFHSQVVNSWLPSRDDEFTRWMECGISIPFFLFILRLVSRRARTDGLTLTICTRKEVPFGVAMRQLPI